MDQNLYQKLFTPQGLNQLLESDFSERRSSDPKALEAFIQVRHRDMMQAALDIARAEVILVKTQTDRYREREKDQYKKKEKERIYIHPTFQLRKDGYSWIATWRKGTFIKTKDGKYYPRHRHIATNKDGNVSLRMLRHGPKWSQDLAQDCEAEFVKLRLLNSYLVHIRESIYRSSRYWRQYFDTQPGCSGFDDRVPALTQSEANASFAKRYEIQTDESD